MKSYQVLFPPSPAVPDVSLSGLGTSPQSLKSLLSALGLSQKKPAPQRFEFSSNDPLGLNACRTSTSMQPGEGGDGGEGGEGGGGVEEGVSSGVAKISQACEDIIQQVQKLKSIDENFTAVDRIASATQTLVARHLTMLAIATLSTQGTEKFLSSLKALNLLDVKSLVRLLRLVHAGRINGTPGQSFSLKTASSLLPVKGLECLSVAITTVVAEHSSAGSQLMHACSRDLLAAAVGGAELLHRGNRRRRGGGGGGGGRRERPRVEMERGDKKSDVSILSNPSFTVSQSLVQSLAGASGRLSFPEGSVGSEGMLQMVDALAACLFSSKLEPGHRFWALEQLLKVFSSSGGSSARREAVARMIPEGEGGGCVC